MKKITKQIYLVMIGVFSSASLFAQWCPITTAAPYSPNMPGITNVTVGNINRTSLDLENSSNSYIITGLTLNLVQGNNYTMSITHTIDAQICPDMNLRVYIDYNRDYSFDDPGETVISTDHHLPGTFTASFTVPMTTIVGATRMRVLSKMSNLGGHSAPTSCDNPPDPLGFHGEVEDYDVDIASTVGINDVAFSLNNFALYPNPASTDLTLDFSLTVSSLVTINIYDVVGKRVYAISSSRSSGKHILSMNLTAAGILQKGIYFIEMNIGSKSSIRRFVVL